MHFVDTNLLVYARDDAEPEKRDRAREIMQVGFASGFDVATLIHPPPSARWEE